MRDKGCAIISVGLVTGVFFIASPFLWDGGVCCFLSPPQKAASDAAQANFGESWASVMSGLAVILGTLAFGFGKLCFDLGRQHPVIESRTETGAGHNAIPNHRPDQHNQ